MSATPTEPIIPTTALAAQPEPPKDQPPAQETDWKSEARKWEDRAKANAEQAKANAEAAKKLAEIEDANKTELEKAMARAEAAEKTANDAADQVIQAKKEAFAATKGVPVSMVTGATPEEWEAAVTAALAWKGEKPALPAAASAQVQGKVGEPVATGTEAEQLTAAIATATAAGKHAEAIALKRQLSALQNKPN